MTLSCTQTSNLTPPLPLPEGLTAVAAGGGADSLLSDLALAIELRKDRILAEITLLLDSSSHRPSPARSQQSQPTLDTAAELSCPVPLT